MKAPRYSKAALHRTLQCCAAAIVVCALAAGFASTRRTAAQHRNELAAQRVRAARSRLDLANEHRVLIDKYRDRYQQLVREGLLVRFDRAVASDWFEAAINARNGARIDSYVVGKDALYAGPDTAELSAFRVVSHRLEFNATAADEDEFADLMNTIEKRVPGTTAQEACSVARDRQSSVAEELALHCALVWYEFAPSNTELTANQSGTSG
jgi:t-SNARE complex subunit (syntaxin)